MKPKKGKIGLFSTDHTLADFVLNYASARHFEVLVSSSLLHEAIPMGKQMEAEGAEAILSVTGTGSLLREHVQIPVVTFSRNSIDLFRGLNEAALIGKRVIFPIYGDTPIGNIGALEQLYSIRIKPLSYHNAAFLKEKICEAAKDGYDVLMGAGLGIGYARDLGLQVVELKRHEKDIESSIETAFSIILKNREEQEKTERFRCIFDAVSEGIITSDKNGRITTINRIAKAMIGLEAEECIGKSVGEIISLKTINRVLSNNKPVYDSLEKIGKKTIVCNHYPFHVGDEIAGCVSTLNEISNVIRSEIKIRKTLSRGHIAKYTLADLLYQSKTMKETVEKAIQSARTSSNLLITGDTGTGKEILAQGVHNLSSRKKNPFISLNCAALPDQLLESELFGYEEGAFTGTRKGGKPGLFELAHKGTIFLDEIGETSENVQIRLLRVLQEREIMRLGGDQLIPIDVRIIAASNKDLGKEIQKGAFREDLYFRLNVLRISVPPLKDRSLDIPILAHSFIKTFSKEHGLKPIKIPASYIQKLISYRWPGNVRQLKNFIERLVLMSPSKFNANVFDEIHTEFIQYSSDNLIASDTSPDSFASNVINQSKKKHQTEQIKKALAETGYSKSKAAEKLGISRTTLWKRMKAGSKEA